MRWFVVVVVLTTSLLMIPKMIKWLLYIVTLEETKSKNWASQLEEGRGPMIVICALVGLLLWWSASLGEAALCALINKKRGRRVQQRKAMRLDRHPSLSSSKLAHNPSVCVCLCYISQGRWWFLMERPEWWSVLIAALPQASQSKQRAQANRRHEGCINVNYQLTHFAYSLARLIRRNFDHHHHHYVIH